MILISDDLHNEYKEKNIDVDENKLFLTYMGKIEEELGCSLNDIFNMTINYREKIVYNFLKKNSTINSFKKGTCRSFKSDKFGCFYLKVYEEDGNDYVELQYTFLEPYLTFEKESVNTNQIYFTIYKELYSTFETEYLSM